MADVLGGKSLTGVEYKDIVDNITDILVVLDHSLNFTYWNQTAEQAGIAVDAYGKSILDLFPRIKNTEVEEILRNVLYTNKPSKFRHKYAFPDGDHTFEVFLYSCASGIIILARDITYLIKVEEFGRDIELRFKQTLDNLIEGCAIFGYDWKYLYVNESNARHARHSIEELLGRTLQEVFPGVEDSVFFKTYKRVMDSRVPDMAEAEFTFMDGSRSWFEVKVMPIPEGIFIFTSDITERKRDEEKILKYQSILNQSEKMAHLGSWWIDLYYLEEPEKNILHWSDEVYNIFGYQQGLPVTQELFYNSIHPDDLKRVKENISQSINERKDIFFEHRIVRPDGNIRIVQEHAVINYDEDGKPVRMVGAVQDITEFRNAFDQREVLLKEIANERDKLKTILESVPAEIWIVDSEGKYLEVNKTAMDGLGLKNANEIELDEILSSLNVRNDEGNERLREDTPLIRGLKGEVVSGIETIKHPLSGETRYRHYHSAPIKDNAGKISGVVAVVNDVTEQRKSEEYIKASLKEKEVLLRELYHRTKNNMQVISSLLSLKASSIEDEKTYALFEEMKNRIQTIALVHQKLYQTQNLSRIDLGEYISELTDLLISSYSISPKHIDLVKELDSVSVLIDTAIPCGLIINELLSNSIKYAFPNRNGRLLIRLSQVPDNKLEIEISDNGKGISKEDLGKKAKLGLQIFKLIAEDQLQAEIKLDTSHGTSWIFRFRETLYKERV